MHRIIGALLIFTSITTLTYGQQKIDNKFGKGLYNVVASDSSWSMRFGLRFQSLYIGETVVNNENQIGDIESQFLIRRARLKFDGFAYSPKLKYKLELGVSNRDLGKVDSRNNMAPNMILDAVLKWNFYGNFELWGGQTKLPGNRERVISSANMQLVDRSVLNSEYNIDRDMGAQLRHKTKIGKSFVVKEIIAVSQGEGRNVVQKNLGGFQYTSRVEILPFGEFSGKGDYIGGDLKREKKPKLSLGVTCDYNDRAVKDKSNQGSYMSYDTNRDGKIDGYFESNITTLFADVMFKYNGFSFMGEYALRDADKIEQSIINDDSSTSNSVVNVGNGLNLQAGYLFKNNWEVAGRYTQINHKPITGDDNYAQYTLGFSKYIAGHSLKVQTDVSYLTVDGGSADSELMYRLQVDIHF